MDKNTVSLTADEILAQSDVRELTREEAVTLLKIDNCSGTFYRLLEKANHLTRTEYRNKAYIFSQVGLNAMPCSGNCAFCSLAASNYAVEHEFQKTFQDIEDIKSTVRGLTEAGTHDIFLMTTADYPMDEYLKIGRAVKEILPGGVRLVANVGDFGPDFAEALKQAGFTGVYHIRRLGEGVDTAIDPEIRLQTIDHIVNSGLELYYCIEPIGPEHTYEDIAEEMLRARRLHVKAMAVMRRTPVPGTPLAARGMITSLELTKIAAVTRLVSRPGRSMNVHEVTPMSLLAGINQLYAEAGANPRDLVCNTANGRGYSVAGVRALLEEAQYELA